MNLMDILHNLFFFIVAIGILVTFHEYGHYWVARRSGVKVLKFSIGFGYPLITWTRKNDKDSVQYAISAIPLGGYVKMLDEREGNVTEDEKHRSFNAQTVQTRMAIVSAGPIFNFILAIFFYWIVFMLGSDGVVPLLGTPASNSIAEIAGVESEDEVIAVGSQTVQTWNELRVALIDQGLSGGDLVLTVINSSGLQAKRVLGLGDMQMLQDQKDIAVKIGLSRWSPELPPIIGGVLADSAAEKSGITEGDTVLNINAIPINTWNDLVQTVKLNPGKTLKMMLESDGVQRQVDVIPDSIETDQGVSGRIGAYQSVPEDIIKRMSRHVEYNAVSAMGKAVSETWRMSILTLRVLGKMLTGEASVKNISGPITIAQYAGITAKIGFAEYLGLLAIISLSLGVLNLLPIPVLDGGHLFYFLIEIVRGSPLSDETQMYGQRIGIFLLGLLMVVAVVNDIQRLVQ